MFKCNECGKLYKTVSGAGRAMNHGCTKCGGSDIDVAPLPPPPSPEAVKKAAEAASARYHARREAEIRQYTKGRYEQSDFGDVMR